MGWGLAEAENYSAVVVAVAPGLAWTLLGPLWDFLKSAVQV